MKKKASKGHWTTIPDEPGWYWIRYKGATELWGAGCWTGSCDHYIEVGYDFIPIEKLSHCEFQLAETPE